MAGGKLVLVADPTKRRKKRRSRIPRRVQTVRLYKRPTYSNANQNIGLPPTKNVTLCYNETIAMTSSSGTLSYYTFILNSLFDPNSSGSGHQAFGHDEWANLYKSYRVNSATIKTTFFHAGTGLTPVAVGTSIDRNAALDGTLSTRVERSRGTQYGILTINSREKYVNKQTVNVTKFFDGQNKYGTLAAAMGANPGAPVYGMIWCQSADTATTSGTVLAEVTITFNCTLSDCVELTGS